MWSITPSSGGSESGRSSRLLAHVLGSPVPSLRPQADVPGGDPQEDVVPGVQVPLQRPDPDPEPQGQRSDLQTAAQFPTMQQQEEHAEPEPGRRYGPAAGPGLGAGSAQCWWAGWYQEH